MGSKETAALQQLLAFHITEIEFPTHICNLLLNHDVNTVGDLVKTPESKLRKYVGDRRFAQVEDKILKLGFKVAQ